MVTDCVGAAQVLAGARSVSVQALAPADVQMQADESLLRQMILNLVENAVRHTPPNGSVDVSLDADPDSGPHLGLRHRPRHSRGRTRAHLRAVRPARCGHRRRRPGPADCALGRAAAPRHTDARVLRAWRQPLRRRAAPPLSPPRISASRRELAITAPSQPRPIVAGVRRTRRRLTRDRAARRRVRTTATIAAFCRRPMITVYTAVGQPDPRPPELAPALEGGGEWATGGDRASTGRLHAARSTGRAGQSDVALRLRPLDWLARIAAAAGLLLVAASLLLRPLPAALRLRR